MQYGALMAGVAFGFLTGGFIYQAYKIDGVAIFGSIVMSIQVRNARTPHRLVLGVQTCIAPWQVLSTITYFLLIAWKARVTKRKVVELKAVSTYDQASAEVVSKFRADSFKARGFWYLGTHRLTAAGVQGSSVTRACLRGCGTGTQVDR
eukprot:scaffold70267_cov78-Phaeocystis_antarctica.AAC.1